VGRRALGEVGALTLAEAREKARGWLALISRGLDPRDEERRTREQVDARRAATFEAAIETYIAEVVHKQRRGPGVEREIRRELIPHWDKKPLSEITDGDVVKLVKAIKVRPAPYQAHNVLGHVRTFFNWAISERVYGLQSSPCDRIRPAKLIGAKEVRRRVLNDEEIRALWHASGTIAYPIGPLYQLLLLTGQRLSEVARARWREFDFEARVWVIPPERFKSDATHLVPLADVAFAVLNELPRFGGGDAVFTTTAGLKPINGFSKAKDMLDRAMQESLGREPAHWTNHDIRRTVRTRLSKCKVQTEVAERVIGHLPKGLRKVYDHYDYLDEKREALEAWEAALLRVVAS
jgi:integrase